MKIKTTAKQIVSSDVSITIIEFSMRSYTCKMVPRKLHFLFVDGTVYQIAKSKNNLRQFYNGNKWPMFPWLKFQIIVLPNVTTGNLSQACYNS